MGASMYLEHFGLERQPFKITPDPSLFYSGSNRGAILQALQYAICSGEGMVKVVGEVGSGKTMLCRMLEQELSELVEVIYIANPSLSPDNILHAIAFELNLDISSETRKLQVMHKLQLYLLEKHTINQQVVVFVEEAQSMPIETLEEIRLLSNLETADHKLLQMVLFGQPELDLKLREPGIRQLKERITHNFYLTPFPAGDVYSYLNFRMRAVGYRGPDLFSRKLARRIERESSGLTRRINVLADKILLAAFSEGGHSLKKEYIKRATRDSEFTQYTFWTPTRITFFICCIVLAMWTGTFIPDLTKTTGSTNSVKLLTPNASVIAMPDSAVTTQTVHQPASEQIPLNAMANAHEPMLFLQQRLIATRQWIRTANPQHFSIQLALIDQHPESQIQYYLIKLFSLLDLQKLYIYQTSISGRKQYSVLYSEYKHYRQAKQELQALPESLSSSGPFIRSIKSLRPVQAD